MSIKKLKRFAVGILPILAILFFAAACSKNTPKPTTKENTSACEKTVAEITVTIKDDSFSPPSLNIKNCTKVIFINEGSQDHWPASDLHPTHGIFPEFDPLKGIKPNEEWAFVFKKTGPWKYHDHLNPQIRGIIIVDN